jgi:hypothetical protein
LATYADLFDSDLDGVAVNLAAKIAARCVDVFFDLVSEGGLEPPRPLIGH